jgi:hypothetical protein
MEKPGSGAKLAPAETGKPRMSRRLQVYLRDRDTGAWTRWTCIVDAMWTRWTCIAESFDQESGTTQTNAQPTERAIRCPRRQQSVATKMYVLLAHPPK